MLFDFKLNTYVARLLFSGLSATLFFDSELITVVVRFDLVTKRDPAFRFQIEYDLIRTRYNQMRILPSDFIHDGGINNP